MGGMAGQQWGIYDPADGDGGMDEDTSGSEEDEVPFLSSQGSTSTVSSEGSGMGVYTPGGNKRRFFEDEEGGFGSAAAGTGTSSFGTGFGTGSGFGMGSGLGDRVLAVPRRKKGSGSGKVPVHTAGQVWIFGQENFNVGGGGKEDVDFEDAEFLDYGLIGNADGEVEMGGCN